MNNVLVVVAHPDDEVLGMGGTIARLTDEEVNVHLLIVTDGSTSQYADNPNLKQIIDSKKAETRSAAKILGIKSVDYGNLPDMKLDCVPHVEINKVIEKTINKYNPDTVFTHFWGDVNKDHRCVFESVLVATRPTSEQSVKELYSFRVPSSTEWTPNKGDTMFMPNLFVDISKYTKAKFDAMMSYVTEIRDYPHPRSIEYLKKNDELAGLQLGVAAVEQFVTLRKLI